MTLKNFGFLALPLLLLCMSSCLGDDDKTINYSEWRTKNLEYFDNAMAATVNGVKQYTPVTPAWDKNSTILMQWHNDRSLTEKNLSPMDNSTVDIKYILTNIEGDTIETSYSLTANGDSIYRCRPNEMITGFQIALTSMHIGDTVTTVIPYTAAYGSSGHNSILPYSTLIFGIKLVDIYAWETNAK